MKKKKRNKGKNKKIEEETLVTMKRQAPNVQRKNQEQKRKKTYKKIKFILKIILILGLISGGLAFALISPIFNIKNIEVVENNKISTDTIISLSTLKTDENIFKFYSKAIENKIKEEPYVEEVKVHRKLPDTIEIKVTERVATYAVDYMGQYAYINTQGYILEISKENQNMPILQGATTNEEEFEPGKRLNSDDLSRLEDVIEIMNAMTDSNLNEKVTSIDISDKNEYIIYLADEKKRVHIGDTGELSNKLLYVQSIIENEKNVEGDIFVNGDLNDGFNPYFRDKV